VAERVAAGFGDVGGVAVVLLRRPHDLRLSRPGEPARPRGSTAPGAGGGAGARIAGGEACSHLRSPCGLLGPHAIEFQNSEELGSFAMVRCSGPGRIGRSIAKVCGKTPCISAILIYDSQSSGPHVRGLPERRGEATGPESRQHRSIIRVRVSCGGGYRLRKA
jgi:hypothetical protein